MMQDAVQQLLAQGVPQQLLDGSPPQELVVLAAALACAVFGERLPAPVHLVALFSIWLSFDSKLAEIFTTFAARETDGPHALFEESPFVTFAALDEERWSLWPLFTSAIALSAICWNMRWSTTKDGLHLRRPLLLVIGPMALLASGYAFNFVARRAHNGDRALVAGLAIGAWRRPSLLFTFVPVVMLMTTQWGMNAMGQPDWYFIKWGCCSSLLVAVASDVLFRRLGGKSDPGALIRLLHIAAALQYFYAGVGKLQLQWATFFDAHQWSKLWHFMAAGDFVWGTRALCPELFDLLLRLTSEYDSLIRHAVPVAQAGGALVVASACGFLSVVPLVMMLGFHFVIGFTAGDIFWGHSAMCCTLIAISWRQWRLPSLLGVVLLVGHALPVLTSGGGHPPTMLHDIFDQPWAQQWNEVWPLKGPVVQRDAFMPQMAFWTVPATFRLRLEVDTDQGSWSLDPKAFTPFDVVFGRANFNRFNLALQEPTFMGLGECGHPVLGAFFTSFGYQACAIESEATHLDFSNNPYIFSRCGPRAGFQQDDDPSVRAVSLERAEFLISRLLEFVAAGASPASASLWWPWRLLDYVQRGMRARWNFVDHLCCHGAAAGDDPEAIKGTPLQVRVMLEEGIVCETGGYRSLRGFTGAIYKAEVENFALKSFEAEEIAVERELCREPMNAAFQMLRDIGELY